MTNQEVRNKVIEKLLRKSVIGGRTVPIKGVSGWFPTHQRGDVTQEVRDMIADPTVPLVQYGGGHRDSVHITDVKDAVRYLDRHGGDVPFTFDKYLD